LFVSKAGALREAAAFAAPAPDAALAEVKAP